MKKIKKLIAGALLVASITALSGCAAKTNPNTTLAEVNGKKITLSQVDTELYSFINYLKENNGDDFEKKLDEQMKVYLNSQRATVLNQLIQEEILLKKAEELKLAPSEEELAKLFEERITSLEEYYGGKEELENIKKESNYTEEKFNTMIENQIIQEIVINHIIKDVEVSEEEISDYYTKNKDTYYTQKPGAYTKHILFKEKEDAQKCLDEINSGKTTFEEAFKKYSSNAGTEEYPLSEDLDYVEYEEANFDEGFLDGLKTLKVNEVSKPVESSFGFHLIQVSKIQNEDVVIEFDKVKDEIKETVLYNKQYELYNNQLKEWEEEVGVKITAEAIGYNPEEE